MKTDRLCRCGHGIDHPRVSVETEHSPLGYFRLIIGGTPVPKKVRWRCRTCGQTLAESTDYEERRQHT